MTYLETLERACKDAQDSYLIYQRGPFPDPDRLRELHSVWFSAIRAVNREKQSLSGGGAYRNSHFTKEMK